MSELPTEESDTMQSIYKDLLDLRQIKAERDALTRSNCYYSEQLSEMEVKISELKAVIHAKELDNHNLKELLKPVDSSSRQNYRANTYESHGAYEEEIISLKADNKSLRSQVKDFVKYKRAFEDMKSIKENLEEKYKEAKRLLIKFERKSFDEDEDVEAIKEELKSMHCIKHIDYVPSFMRNKKTIKLKTNEIIEDIDEVANDRNSLEN